MDTIRIDIIKPTRLVLYGLPASNYLQAYDAILELRRNFYMQAIFIGSITRYQREVSLLGYLAVQPLAKNIPLFVSNAELCCKEYRLENIS